MKLEIEIPEENIANAICSAVESGIYYWCDSVEFRGVEGKPSGQWENDSLMARYFTPLQNGKMIVRESQAEPGEDPKNHGRTFVLCKQEFIRSLQLMSQKVPRQFAAILQNDSDRDTGDLLIQLACFGEIKYG